MRSILLALAAASLAAAESGVTVRLYSIDAPAAASVLPGKGECRIRSCARCREKPLTAAVALHAGMELRGACTLAVPGEGSVHVSWPVEIRAAGRRLAILVRMPVEDYVAGVLGGEGTVLRSREALKAMAVTARTYAVRNRARHRAEGFDFCDTTHCQDLRLSAISDRLRAAADATEGEILWYRGSPAYAFYHRHCGGMTESAANVWPGLSAPYLLSQPDTFCTGRDRGEWRARISQPDLRQALALSRPVDGIAILRRSSSGRALELSAGGTRVSADALHLAVGRALGWNLLRSTLYEVARSADGFVFQGRGAGHGVGLCQAGAAERGELGHTYRQILDFYFPGTTIGVSAQGFSWQHAGGERVDLETTRATADGFAAARADRALLEAERRTGFPLPFRPRVRVYPTVAAFRDATGEPGWVAASTLGRTVRIQPLEVLRSRGVLEAVLLHEMLHLLIESRAHPGTPDWFREGLVLQLEGAAAHSRPGAGEAARTRRVYAQARGCVERLERTRGRGLLFDWLQHGLPPGEASACAP